MPIIISRGGKDAQKVAESGVENEAYLQDYVAENPDALPIDDIKENVRLLIVGKEFAVPSGYIDILALDGDGDIYIIETKLFSNADKRLVIAQMLDYGASLWKSYPDPAAFVADVENALAATRAEGLYSTVVDFFELSEIDVEGYVENLRRNLQNGAYHFVVLMDRLDARLKDLILFMNERSSFNIYAVEMEFYRHDGLEIVIPKLFGAEIRKAVSNVGNSGRQWDRTSFLEEVESRHGDEITEAIKDVLDWAGGIADEIRWGKGAKTGSFSAVINCGTRQVAAFYVYTDGTISFWPVNLRKQSSLSSDDTIAMLRDRLNSVAGLDITAEDFEKYFYKPWTCLLDHKSADDFRSVISWMVEEMRGADDTAA